MPRRRSKTAKAPRSYHHGDLRRALIETSIELIAEKGVSALTLREVARRLGVSHAAPRHHFADKTELLAAVAMEGFEALGEAIREAVADVTKPGDQFKRMGIAYVRFAVSHPAHFRVMYCRELAEASPPPLRDYWGTNPSALRMAAVTTEALSVRQDADEALVRTGVVSAWSLVHGLAMLWIDGPLRQVGGKEMSDEELDAMACTIIDFVVDAIGRGL